jgi:putative phage-type endonuclease
MKTQIINHVQGTEAWHKHRAQHLNASDAAAVLGLSSYKTRTQLLHEKATGFAKEVDAATQQRFAKGHEFEATARPWAEEIIGSELFPVVLAGEYEGLNLSASLDGTDMASDFNFEHKSGRADLLASLDDGVIPAEYHPQMEMGLMLSGAGKCLFMASSGNKDAMRFAWYEPKPELRAQIIAAWHQFNIDLAAYQAPEVIVPAVAAPQLGLPAVSIQVNGSIALVDNLDKFGAALNAYIAKLNRKPETDQDFANLEDAVKRLKVAEEQLDAAESGALGQVESVDSMRKTVALHRETARATRLLVTKLVEAEKVNRKTAIVSDAAADLVTHIKKLNDRLGKSYMPAIAADFQGVIKGLKSLDSMKDKVSTELARCKIAANEAADRIQANLTTLRELASEYTFLFADTAQLVGKANDDLTALVKSRIADHKAAEAKREEETRERIRAEEQAKAEKDAREKVAAEKAAAADEQAERERIAAEAAKVERIVTAPSVAPAPAPAAVPFEAVVAMMPPAVRQAMAPAAKPDSEPTLKLGTISERLAPLSITADGLRTLGFEPSKVQGASKLFHESDFSLICAALIAHISEVQDQFEPATA